jgi:hypothetical protein
MTRIDRAVNNTVMGVVGVVLMLGLVLAIYFRLA